DHGRRCLADGRDRLRGPVHREPDPDHPRAHHARAPPAGRPGEPRGRRAGEVRRTTGRPAPAGHCGRGGPVSTDFAEIARAIKDIAAGRPVVVVDDEDRENEGDLIFAAEKATPELLAFMVRYTSGYICVPLTE